MLWLRAGVWMELILPGGSRRPCTAFGNVFQAALGSGGSIQPGLFHVGVQLMEALAMFFSPAWHFVWFLTFPCLVIPPLSSFPLSWLAHQPLPGGWEFALATREMPKNSCSQGGRAPLSLRTRLWALPGRSELCLWCWDGAQRARAAWTLCTSDAV